MRRKPLVRRWRRRCWVQWVERPADWARMWAGMRMVGRCVERSAMEKRRRKSLAAAGEREVKGVSLIELGDELVARSGDWLLDRSVAMAFSLPFCLTLTLYELYGMDVKPRRDQANHDGAAARGG